MERYVDGYVLPVPTKNLEEYKKMAAEGGKMWMKHGALQYVEAVGDDLKAMTMEDMKTVTFPDLAKAQPDETIIFAFVVYKSKEHRDEVNAKVMQDPSMGEFNHKDMKMPFDMRKMAYGGFKTLVDLK